MEKVTEGKIRRGKTKEEKSLGNTAGMQREKHVWLQGGKVTRERCRVAKRVRQENITEWGHGDHSISLHHTSVNF